MSGYLLGIDNGGTVSKVVIFDTNGNEICTRSRKITTLYPKAGWAERDMEEVWLNTSAAIQEAIAAAGIAPQKILAIGNASHGNGLYLLDKQGRPLRNAILSVDTRAAEFVSRWKEQRTLDQLWRVIYQQLWAAQPTALLAWLKKYEPENYRRIGAVLLSKDYIKFRLTGSASTDFTDISATSLLNFLKQDYDESILHAFSLSDIQPALVAPKASHEIVGTVTSQAARETGLQEGTPVVGGMFDVSACALGAGVLHPGQICVVSGTWSINAAVTASIADNRNLFMNSIYVDNTFIAIESSPTSATNLEWFVNHFCVEEKALAATRGISVYEVCNEIVKELAPGSTNIIFHPFLYGSNVQATARAGFYGVAGWHTKAHLLRAIYEGVVYGHMSHIEKLHHAGIPIESIRFTGGGARSAVWSQMFADALSVPVEVVNGEEIGARGAAMCAGIGVGVYADYADAVKKIVQVARRYEPDAQATPFYVARFKEHQFLTQTLQEAWDRLSKLQS